MKKNEFYFFILLICVSNNSFGQWNPATSELSTPISRTGSVSTGAITSYVNNQWDGTIRANSGIGGYSSFGLYENSALRWSMYNHPGTGNSLIFANSAGQDKILFWQDGSVSIGTTTQLEKLNVNGNVNIAGVAGRRLYMGGVGGTTFGIAYDRSYPSHGIFYTEGNPDYVSLSPNGNANNGVMNVYGNGRVGIGTNTPLESLHVKGRMYLEGTEAYPSGWMQNYFNWRGHSLIMGAPVGEYGHSQIELKSGGSTSGRLDTYFSMFTTPSPNVYEQKIFFSTAGDSYFNSGNLGIGTITPTQKLTVKGTVYSTEVKVDVNAGTGPDYVFEPTYNLPTLAETEAYIKANKHLPEVPSAKEMEANGINLSEMNMLLLKKVEELTLHLIEQQKQNIRQQNEIELLKEKIK